MDDNQETLARINEVIAADRVILFRVLCKLELLGYEYISPGWEPPPEPDHIVND